MEKINQEQFVEFVHLAGGRKGSNELTESLKSLEINEGILLSPEEWKLKSTPSSYANSLRRFGKRYSSRKTSKGIAFLRIG